MNAYKKRGINFQTCKRCGTVFSAKSARCPNCHLKKNDFFWEPYDPYKRLTDMGNHRTSTQNFAIERHETHDADSEVVMISKYIKLSKSGKYHVCTRCNLAFIKEIDSCPRCDVTDEDGYFRESGGINYFAEGTGRGHHGAACDICPHCHGTADWCPLLD